MPELTEASAAFALAAISDSADRASGWSFYIALRDIAAAARLKVRATQYALRELERRGYIRTEEGSPGRARRYRVLFDTTGKRRPESELYPQPPAPNAPPSAKRGARNAGGGAPRAPSGAPKATPPNNPLIGGSVLSPSSIQKSNLKIARRTKKLPEEEAPDYNAEKQRQREAIEAKLKEARP